MSHKKAGGSSKNGRDSVAKRRGVKLFGGEAATAGAILVRQQGNFYRAGDNVGQGRDFTLFSLINGTVEFSEKRQPRFDGSRYRYTYVSVLPETAVSKKVVKKAKPVEEELSLPAEEVAVKEVTKKAPAKKPVAKKAPAKKTTKAK